MSKSKIRTAFFKGADGENIIDAPTISLVSPGTNNVYTGFDSIDEVIDYKLKNGLGSSWRIRDRRCAETPVRGIKKPKDPRDPLLVLVSMIRDHALPILEHIKDNSTRPVSIDRRLAVFTGMILDEIRMCSDRNFGTWHAVRGETMHRGKLVASTWLEDGYGTILDPFTKSTSCRGRMRWVNKMDRRAKSLYFPFLAVDHNYMDPILRIVSGDSGLTGYVHSRQEVYAQMDTLRTHAVASLKASRLPAHAPARKQFELA